MRLDAFLADSGKCESRTLAAKLIKAGRVRVNGIAVLKPSALTEETDRIEICDSELTRYVGRGGLKLEAALEHFCLDVTGATALDIGASTGGFTDCLLKRGACMVYCLDSGHGQLNPSLLQDPRVVNIEGVNARYHESVPIDGQVDIVVMDVSFISQTLLYGTVNRFLADGGKFVSLIKPQFEVDRHALNRHGIVRDEKTRRAAVDRVIVQAEHAGLACSGLMRSPIEGGDGNTEYLAIFEKRVSCESNIGSTK